MKVFIIFVVLTIRFAFNTQFINASGFNESYSLRGGLSTVNEAGIIFYIMEKICKNCQAEFKAPKERSKYCSWNCYLDYKSKNAELFKHTYFKKGQVSWNKGTKGVCKANKTSFKKGNIPSSHLPVNSVLIKKHKREKQSRRFIKVAEPNKWKSYSHYIWEKHFGKIPKNYLIHHKDRNALNDNIDNLELMSRAEHLNEHRKEHNEIKKRLNQKKAWIIRRLRKQYGLPEKRIKVRNELNQLQIFA